MFYAKLLKKFHRISVCSKSLTYFINKIVIIIIFKYREAAFHILITSYQLLVSDEKYFRRVKWQYMVLDEAQAIKSSNRFPSYL